MTSPSNLQKPMGPALTKDNPYIKWVQVWCPHSNPYAFFKSPGTSLLSRSESDTGKAAEKGRKKSKRRAMLGRKKGRQLHSGLSGPWRLAASSLTPQKEHLVRLTVSASFKCVSSGKTVSHLDMSVGVALQFWVMSFISSNSFSNSPPSTILFGCQSLRTVQWEGIHRASPSE